jgi:spermidine/putrescine transport system substrate-binding protein
MMNKTVSGGLRCRMLLATAAAVVLSSVAAQAQDELNALVWCDHTDPALVEPFETANDVKVNLKEYEGTGAALSIIEQSRPGDWDVLVVDAVDVPRVAADMDILGAAAGGIKVPPNDLFPEVRHGREQARPSTARPTPSPRSSATTPSPTTRTKVDPADMNDLSVIWSRQVQGPDRRSTTTTCRWSASPASGIGKKTART